MTISYNWLCDYLPEKPSPEKLSKILTAIGLEVESLEPYAAVKGNLAGLVVGEVMACSKHPDADKLQVTTVQIGQAEPLQIVCGAPNVAVGQKVVVAPVGTTIYPVTGEPVTMKKARIRGVDSFGMICAEDEIGLGASHAGILILPAQLKPGQPVAEHFKPFTDFIYEIGLTPNRMDAMSHLGVARDVCAYLSHHQKKDLQVVSPLKNTFKPSSKQQPFSVKVLNEKACPRYAGISLTGVTVSESPQWLQQRLKSIGLRPINNIVDITNFILHETGQPLHAFDADKIPGRQVIVQNLPEGSKFVTLDGKERSLGADDLLICNTEGPMCIAGVYGGLDSGVTTTTRNIFLESACFDPAVTRRTALRHNLRTDAAARFEKGVDISNTVAVLKRAALLIHELSGGEISGDITDVYPHPRSKTEVTLKYHYLKKLSGKHYHGDTIKHILVALGFEILKEGLDDIRVAVPFSKPDISIPADIVEEIMRIDGLDNIEIPATISMSPAVETLALASAWKEKIAGYLTGLGLNEIFTNSITNEAYYDEAVLAHTVRMLNNLSAELNVLRPAMMETGLETVAYNCNRKNPDLQLFEFGKTYRTSGTGKYEETQHLSIYLTGQLAPTHWKSKAQPVDFYYAKGLAEKLLALAGQPPTSEAVPHPKLESALALQCKHQVVATIGAIQKHILTKFDIRQPVFYIDIDWDKLLALIAKESIQFAGIPRYPAAVRDLSIVVARNLQYADVEKVTMANKIGRLRSIALFDLFESDKLGKDKKAMALTYTFLDEEKTLTDKEIDGMMNRIIASYEKELNAEIRR